MSRSIFMRFWMKRSLGKVDCWPATSILANLSGEGSDRMYQKSLMRLLGQMVMVPLNCWSQMPDQS